MGTFYKLPLILEPQPEGGYVVTCPLLPELVSEGDTIQQAMENAKDALQAIIEAFSQLGRPLPKSLQPAQANAPLLFETILDVA
jgi:antitoxin HicB